MLLMYGRKNNFTEFNPDKHTAKISWQVFKAALFQLSRNKVEPSIL